MTTPIRCNTCGQLFESFNGLAHHIIECKDKLHKKSRRWALSFLSKAKILNQKRDLPVRSKLSEEDRENKISTRRELSGETEMVETICPKCLTKGRAILDVEHAHEPMAWKIRGRFALYCSVCRG